MPEGKRAGGARGRRSLFAVASSSMLVATFVAGPGTGVAAARVAAQEPAAGAELPAMAQTDGQEMVVLRAQPTEVRVVNIGESPPTLGGPIELPDLGAPYGLLLAGEDAVAIGQVVTAAAGGTSEPTARAEVAVVALGASGGARLVRTYSFSGELLGARLMGGQVVLALSRTGPYTVRPPCTGVCPMAAGAAPAILQRVPVGTLTVASFVPGSSAGEVTVAGSASFVYATSSQLFLAGTESPFYPCPLAGRAGAPVIACCFVQPGRPCPASGNAAPTYFGAGTSIFDFDLAVPGRPAYVGSGQIAGAMTDAGELSEESGYLRVVTSAYPLLPISQGAPGPAKETGPAEGTGPVNETAAQAQRTEPQATLTVLQVKGHALVTVGAPLHFSPGTRVCTAVFGPATAYVSTSNYVGASAGTAGLYALDLSQPAAPRVAAYLSGVPCLSELQSLGGTGWIAGVAGPTSTGGVTASRLYVDLFGTQSPGALRLFSTLDLGASATAPLSNSSQPLLWAPAYNLLAFPVTDYPGRATTDYLAVLSVGAAGTLQLGKDLSEPGAAGRAQPVVSSAGVRAALFAGGLLLSVWDKGVLANDPVSLGQIAWLPFPSPGT